MLEMIFLLVLAGIWILFASMQDLREREVANWISFSLIIFALGFRFFYCLFQPDVNFSFFYQGLIGLGIFFVIGNFLYYTRMFAGGDAKLMIALGSVLPFSSNFSVNIRIFTIWFLIFLFAGMFYGLFWSGYLYIKNFKKLKKEMRKQFLSHKKLFYIIMILGLFFIVIGIFNFLFFSLGFIIFVIPYIFIYAKAIDEICMIKKINPKELTEGDWLYKDVKISKSKIIKAHWEGLSLKEIKLLKKSKKQILIRQGIPFVPVFLIAFLVLVYVYLVLKIDFLLNFII